MRRQEFHNCWPSALHAAYGMKKAYTGKSCWSKTDLSHLQPVPSGFAVWGCMGALRSKVPPKEPRIRMLPSPHPEGLPFTNSSLGYLRSKHGRGGHGRLWNLLAFKRDFRGNTLRPRLLGRPSLSASASDSSEEPALYFSAQSLAEKARRPPACYNKSTLQRSQSIQDSLSKMFETLMQMTAPSWCCR